MKDYSSVDAYFSLVRTGVFDHVINNLKKFRDVINTLGKRSINPGCIIKIPPGGIALHSMGQASIPSPRRRLYPPACKPYGLEAEPEAFAKGGSSRNTRTY